jgi:hypothetical protein
LIFSGTDHFKDLKEKRKWERPLKAFALNQALISSYCKENPFSPGEFVAAFHHAAETTVDARSKKDQGE